MATAEAVEAAHLLGQMVRWESRGPGDTDNALRRLGNRHPGVSYSTLWGIRYRRPKRVWADVLFALRAAYEAERQRQLKALAHEAAITATVAGARHPAVVAAETVLGASVGEDA